MFVKRIANIDGEGRKVENETLCLLISVKKKKEGTYVERKEKFSSVHNLMIYIYCEEKCTVIVGSCD